ncbi:hypothetical protein ACIPW5_37900 [Streptomyces sp. NPDC090077]|uniref:hypothetical protein n=1 Tax=Streptomyces sp. NPDC090077 TaxID=3365938 RepID=UPI0038259108
MTTLVALGLLALAGCSSGTRPSSSPSPSWVRGPDPAQAALSAAPGGSDAAARADLERVVRAYSGLYFAGDGGAAHSFRSKRCQDKAGDEAAFTAVVSGAAKDHGPQEIETLDIDQLAGGTARVSHTYAVPGLDQVRQPWTREAGAWKYDGC